MKKIVLTGASGFIGSKLAIELSKVYNLLLPIRKQLKLKRKIFSNSLNYIQGQFFMNEVIAEYKNFRPDFVVHTAAIRGEGRGKKNDYQHINVYGTEQLLNFCLDQNVKLFVYYSTVGVYGTIPSSLPASVETRLNPDNHYHRSKYEAEQLVIQKLHGKIPYVILRPTITYGPGDDGFLPKLINLVKRERFPLIQEDVRIHLLNVHTLSEFISQLVQSDFQDQLIINLADPQPVKLKDVVNLIHFYFHRKANPSYLQIPSIFYTLPKKLCKLLKISALETSLKLLSESWYYDVRPLWENYHPKPVDTLTSIRELLKIEYPISSKGKK
jgi:UDP-glucose 4-epimerase